MLFLSCSCTFTYFRKYVCFTTGGVQVLKVTAAVPVIVAPTIGCTDPPKKERMVGGAPGIVGDGTNICELDAGVDNNVDKAA